MKITEIRAFRDKITFAVKNASQGEEIHIAAYVPLVCGVKDDDSFVPGRAVWQGEAKIENGTAQIARMAQGYDLLLCRFDAGCEGVCYVTEVEAEVSEYHYDYPTLPIKAINAGAVKEDFEYMGFKQTSTGPNQALLMLSKDGPDAIPYVHNGKTYYFRRSYVKRMDQMLQPLARKGVACVMRYINSSFFVGERADQDIVDIIQHPGYDYDYPSAYMGAFNLRTEEGFNHFCACTEFLVERYSREDRKYGWAISFEVGNEVTSQYIWGNAGEMTCAEYMYEYTEVMRICWLLSRKHWSNFRIHTSFDQYFCGCHMPSQPKRFYGMKECIEEIWNNCRKDGDFPWNIAFHPYPENLSYPDFWNDREPNWSFETRRITFKNLEVMPAYLAQERLLYKGEPRRIILPEQGFNSRPEAPYTLQQGKYGYVLAYEKMKKLGTIDLFLHHNYEDNPGEFGLNLGIRYFGGNANDENRTRTVGARKPICDAIAALDTDREPQIIAEARAYIGEEIYDYMLNPPAVVAELDHSGGGLNLPGQGNRRKGKKTKEAAKANFDT